MELIDKAEFDQLVGHLRSSATRLLFDEISWWANENRSILGLVLFDRHDKNYSWVFFVREPDGYATIAVGHSLPSVGDAIHAIELQITRRTTSDELRQHYNKASSNPPRDTRH